MRLFPRREVLDRDVRARLSLAPGERPLAWTRAGDTWLVGTERAVHLVGDEQRVIAWQDVERADWDNDRDRLVIVEVADWGHPEPTYEFAVDPDDDRLLQLLRERVTKSVVVQQFVPVRGRSGITVVARRSPTGRGPVQWSYVIGRGLDPDDPEVRARAEEARSAAERDLELS